MTSYTLIPGDKVRFDGHVWHVFLSPREQHDDSPIVLFRSGEGLAVVDLIRPRRELELIPRQRDDHEPGE